MEQIFNVVGENYLYLDKSSVICCGRPLLLSGQEKAARELIDKNKKLIEKHGAKRLILSCPICYKIFKEEYKLDMEVLHYSEYIDGLVNENKIVLNKGEIQYVYHDPCELGRGCGIYDEPRRVIEHLGELKPAQKEREESLCCGSSLGTLTLDSKDKLKFAESAIDNLLKSGADNIVTACPLCYKTLRQVPSSNVFDLAQIVAKNMVTK